MPIPGVFPAVTGDLVSPSNSSCRHNPSLRAKEMKWSARPIGSKRTCDALAVFEQSDDCVFHEHVEAEMDSVILQCADHLEPRAVTTMRQSRITMTSKIALQDPTIA